MSNHWITRPPVVGTFTLRDLRMCACYATTSGYFRCCQVMWSKEKERKRCTVTVVFMFATCRYIKLALYKILEQSPTLKPTHTLSYQTLYIIFIIFCFLTHIMFSLSH